MVIWQRTFGLGAVSVFVLAACVSDGSDGATTEDAVVAPEISVTVPPERLTPFCQAMIDLTDRLRSDESEVGEAEIIETYRSIRDDVPVQIASDFDAVLEALESGAPPPTDPPPETIVTAPPTAASTATSVPDPASTTPPADVGESEATSVGADVGFADGTTPAERLNNYVTFACRDTQNNPGPPATQPRDDPETDADEG